MTIQECWSSCTYNFDGGKVAQLQCLECIFQTILNLTIRLAGLALFVMLIIGGFKYLTSGGDPKSKEVAQKTITSAVLGLVLIFVGWLVFRFIEEFTGVNVTEFRIIPK